jgi:hypothetical protein
MGNLGDALRKDLDRQMRRVGQEVAADMTAELRRTSPVITGDLYSSITSRYTVTPERVVIDFEADIPYAQYVIEGTRPHVIRATNRRSLSFYWPKVGGQAFFKSVNHPGNSANPFWQTVFNNTRAYILRALR